MTGDLGRNSVRNGLRRGVVAEREQSLGGPIPQLPVHGYGERAVVGLGAERTAYQPEAIVELSWGSGCWAVTVLLVEVLRSGRP